MSYPVAVRALCNFTAKRGDLDRRFTPAPTAQEGMTGHTIVAARRGPDYQAEVSLCGDYKQLRVRGRADGYHAQRLDECKTFRGDLARMPENHRALHWAQLRTYVAVVQRDGLPSLNLALVYLDVESQKETILEEHVDAQTLKTFFDLRCDAFSQWAEHEMAHIAARDTALSQLAFPHASFHCGQRELAEGVYKPQAMTDRRGSFAARPYDGRTLTARAMKWTLKGASVPAVRVCPKDERFSPGPTGTARSFPAPSRSAGGYMT